MRLPIQYALFGNQRMPANFRTLDFRKQLKLDFFPIDGKFPCLQLAYEAAKAGGTMPTVMNAANEIAVHLFLKNKIGFLEIPELIKKVMNEHQEVCKSKTHREPSLATIRESDCWARLEAEKLAG
jgi:1-deoxy-D-xylulose-5-phosphate reductoisomerase